ncbi:hypothetical protein ANN_09660 [Periplaneta americana]|uniref:Mos1 transposase HTH domain-containing protein n=1 Tax=Periplaneta americana TaxID=6978 RepID=A0ABQ8TMY9_PERAM|nr:hypothetical protein ANN_09660 [Periplaneta americana]
MNMGSVDLVDQVTQANPSMRKTRLYEKLILHVMAVTLYNSLVIWQVLNQEEKMSYLDFQLAVARALIQKHYTESAVHKAYRWEKVITSANSQCKRKNIFRHESPPQEKKKYTVLWCFVGLLRPSEERDEELLIKVLNVVLKEDASNIRAAKEDSILRDMLLELNDSCECHWMKINANKTKTMVVARKIKKVNLRIQNETVEDLGRIDTQHAMHVTGSVNRLRPIERSQCERKCHSTMEQRVNIKFCYKLGKTATETHGMLVQVYGREAVSRKCVYEWFKRFREGKETIENEPRSGRPLTSRTPEMIEKLRQMLAQVRRLTLRLIAEELDISKDTVHTIVRDDLGKQKICSRFVPHKLTDEQKAKWMETSGDFISMCDQDPLLLKTIVTGDETWYYQFDPESKRQSMSWCSPTSP